MKVNFKLQIKDGDQKIDRVLHNIARQFSLGDATLSEGPIEIDGVNVGSWKLEVEE